MVNVIRRTRAGALIGAAVGLFVVLPGCLLAAGAAAAFLAYGADCPAAEAQEGPAGASVRDGGQPAKAGEDEIIGEAGTAGEAAPPDEESEETEAEASEDGTAEAVAPEENGEEPEERDPFRISAKLLREAAGKAAPKLVVKPEKIEEELPHIRMTGVMIVGDSKMATAEVGRVGTVTLVQGERVVLRPSDDDKPLIFTVKDIEERHLTIITNEGTEIRALFK